jgi:hypothetical protein
MNIYDKVGLISKQPIDNIDENLHLIRYENKKSIVQMSNKYKKIKTINVHPVGRICYGSCSYCYNTYYPYTHFSDGYLTQERFDNFLKESYNFFEDPVLFKFTGGSCFLYDDLYLLFNIAKKYVSKLHLRFHADLMYPEDVYQKVLQLFNRLNKDNDIGSIKMYVTTDYGSDTRFAKKINITTKDIRKRVIEIIRLFGYEEKFQIEVKINLNKYTNIDVMHEHITQVYSLPCWIVYNPVRHLEYSPSLEQLQNQINSIDEKYNTHVVYWREKVIINDLVQKALENKSENTFNTIFQRVNDNVLLYNPYYFDCPGYIVSTGISPTKYLPCFIGYIEEDTFEDSMTLRKDHELYDSFLNLTDECKQCNLVGVCMRCMLRRQLLPCSKTPALKYWEKYIWDSKVKQKDYWLDEKLEPLRW